MNITRKSFTENQNKILFSQVNGLCPKCSKKLTYKKNGKIFNDYDLAHIYPLNPSIEEKKLLKNEKLLNEDLNHLDNIIPLCGECHSKFDKPRTVKEYRELYNIKKKLIEKERISSFFGPYYLSPEIIEVINGLYKRDYDGEPIELNYSATEVGKKLCFEFDVLLKNQILMDVMGNYPHIKKVFSDMETSNSGTFDLISAQIKTFYLQMKKEKISQESIFHSISEWIYKNSESSSLRACQIITSFFIQNCEVFEDVTK